MADYYSYPTRFLERRDYCDQLWTIIYHSTNMELALLTQNILDQEEYLTVEDLQEKTGALVLLDQL